MMLMFIACYIRKSVVEDDATASPARQRAAIERVVPAKYERRWYQDLDISGRHEAGRPDFMRLLTDLSDPECAGVAAESLDRLYRNRVEFGAFKTRLDAAGQLLIVANLAGVDGNTAAGNLFLGVVSEVGEFEARIASERMTGHIRHLRHDQGRHWGNHPYGCARDPQTRQLIPSPLSYYYDPATGAAQLDPAPGWEQRFYHDGLTQIYRLYSQGDLSFYDVCQRLHAAGWRFWTKDGGHSPIPFNRETVRSIIRRWQLYAGELPTRKAGHLQGGHDPILPIELCQEVGRVLTQRHQVRNGGKTASNGYTYLLTGILFCGVCGARLGGQRVERGEAFYYRHQYNRGACPERMTPAAALEDMVIDRLRPVLNCGPLIEQVRAAMRQAEREANQGSGGPAAQLVTAESELERLIDLHVSGLISREQFETRRASLWVKIEALRAAAGPLLDPLARLGFLQDLPDLAELSPADQRVIIHGLVSRIEIANRVITRLEPTGEAAALFQMVETGNPSSVGLLVDSRPPG